MRPITNGLMRVHFQVHGAPGLTKGAIMRILWFIYIVYIDFIWIHLSCIKRKSSTYHFFVAIHLFFISSYIFDDGKIRTIYIVLNLFCGILLLFIQHALCELYSYYTYLISNFSSSFISLNNKIHYMLVPCIYIYLFICVAQTADHILWKQTSNGAAQQPLALRLPVNTHTHTFTLIVYYTR